MIDQHAIDRAAAILREGGLVAFPTETVYGLGADASNPEAIARLYLLKGRPASHPVIVHVSDADAAFEWAREVSESARRLAAAFWPGPLTLILKRSARALDCVTGGQDAVGIRVPSHPVAQALLRAFGGGVAAPSANRYGRISPTRAEHIRDDFGRDAPMVLEGGESDIGIESSIVDCSGSQPVLLRPGHITPVQIEAILGRALGVRAASAPRHSGGEARHYAPQTPARLVNGAEMEALLGAGAGPSCALVLEAPAAAAAYRIRMPVDPEAYAHRLYAALRELDAQACERILIEAPPANPGWAAVCDRLRRAVSPGTIPNSDNSPLESESP